MRTGLYISPTALPPGPPPYRIADLRAATDAARAKVERAIERGIAARAPQRWAAVVVGVRNIDDPRSTFQVWV